MGGQLSLNANANLTSCSLASLASAQSIYITDNSSLGTFSAPALTSCGGINFGQNGVTSINLGALTTMGGQLSLNANANLTSCSLGSLASAESIAITSNGLTSLSLPVLTTLTGGFSVTNNSSLGTFSAPALATMNGQLSLTGNANLTTCSLGSLATLGSISFQNNPSVSMLNISSLLTIPNGLYINNCNLLTNIIWPSNVSSLYANSPYALDCSSNSLSSSEINEILALYVSLGNYGPSNMNISFQNPPAPPIGQGINDVNTLMSIGVNVTTD